MADSNLTSLLSWEDDAAEPALGRLAAARDGDAPPPDGIVLSLADLLPDTGNEVVLFADDAPVTLVGDVGVHAEGIAGTHVTDTGVDVTGYAFLQFANGLTLYFEPGALVSVIPPEAA